MGLFQGFLFGFFGGCLPEILTLHKIRYGKTPDYISRPFFWITSILMMCTGGLLVIVYLVSGIDLSPIVCVNVGASAPLIIGTIKTKTPHLEPGKVDTTKSESK